MISKLLVSPFWITIVTIGLWIVIFNLLYRLLKISETNWKRLEYAWILTGFIGLVSLVVENKRSYNTYTSQRIGHFIKQDISMLQSVMSSSQTCFEFIRSEYSPPNFDDLQHDQKQICNWSKSYKIETDSVNGIPVNNLDSINSRRLLLKTDAMNDYIERFNKDVAEINRDLKEYRTLTADLESDDWRKFAQTFGVLLISIAFGVRLSIATKNVIQTKKTAHNIGFTQLGD